MILFSMNNFYEQKFHQPEYRGKNPNHRVSERQERQVTCTVLSGRLRSSLNPRFQEGIPFSGLVSAFIPRQEAL